MRRDARGRLVVQDVLFVLMSFAFLAVLWEPFMEGLDEHAGIMPVGTVLLFRMLLPFAVLVLMSMIYVKAVRGANV